KTVILLILFPCAGIRRPGRPCLIGWRCDDPENDCVGIAGIVATMRAGAAEGEAVAFVKKKMLPLDPEFERALQHEPCFLALPQAVLLARPASGLEGRENEFERAGKIGREQLLEHARVAEAQGAAVAAPDDEAALLLRHFPSARRTVMEEPAHLHAERHGDLLQRGNRNR